jgi:S1-C subfamily serine protease
MYRHIFVRIILLLIPFNAIADTRQHEKSANEVYSIAIKSVVTVQVNDQGSRTQGSGVAFENGVNPENESIPNGTWVITNAHVVGESKNAAINYNNSIFTGEVKYRDKELDLALIFLPTIAIYPADIVGSYMAKPGDTVYAIGSPFGLDGSISDGIVSSVRLINGTHLIQTTAPISHGNSGGGLFNSKGKLIGITSFKLKGGENVNFAVDAAYAKTLIRTLGAALLLEISAYRLVDEYKSEMLKSESFIKWLSSKKDSDGNYLYKQLSVYLKSPLRNQRIQEIVDDYVSYAKTSSVSQSHKQEQGQLLTLQCQVESSNYNNDHRRKTILLKLDLQSLTVNGWLAKVSENEINWSQEVNDNIVAIYSLDRLTGSINIGSKDSPSLYVGKCTPASQRLF